MHAYAMIFAELGIEAGDHVLDLGAGTGYGAALLHHLVGEEGQVIAIEIDPALVRRAEIELRPLGVPCVAANALDPHSWPPEASRMRKVSVGFALEEIPPSWRTVFAPGTVIVAPLYDNGVLRLCRTVLGDNELEQTWLQEVRFVPVRQTAPTELHPAPKLIKPPPTPRTATHLRVVD